MAEVNTPASEVSTPPVCDECERVLDTDGTCWACTYTRLEYQKNEQIERLEGRIRRYESQVSDLESNLGYAECDKNRLEDRVKELERKVQDAEYRASQAERFSNRGRW